MGEGRVREGRLYGKGGGYASRGGRGDYFYLAGDQPSASISATMISTVGTAHYSISALPCERLLLTPPPPPRPAAGCDPASPVD